MDFKIGDVVRLKSGGPAMTVDSVENHTLTCVWFSVARVNIEMGIGLETLVHPVYGPLQNSQFQSSCLVRA